MFTHCPKNSQKTGAPAPGRRWPVAGHRGWDGAGEGKLVLSGSWHRAGCRWNPRNPPGEGAEHLWTLRCHGLEGQLSPSTLPGPRVTLFMSPLRSRHRLGSRGPEPQKMPAQQDFAYLERRLRGRVQMLPCERRRVREMAPLHQPCCPWASGCPSPTPAQSPV